jgi:hypothetical protein
LGQDLRCRGIAASGDIKELFAKFSPTQHAAVEAQNLVNLMSRNVGLLLTMLVVRIKGARALRWVAILMNKARQHLWTTLVRDLSTMCTSAYHQLSNQQGGTYDHRVDASRWDGMNNAPSLVRWRESTVYAGVLLDTDGCMKWHRKKKWA